MNVNAQRIKPFFKNSSAAGHKPGWSLKPTAATENGHHRIATGADRESIQMRWNSLAVSDDIRREIADTQSLSRNETYQHNIENYIGTVKVPVGIAGPLRINGAFAQGDYYVPLATTEAALVASYNRGTCVIGKAGGCTAILLNEGVNRAPGFVFKSLTQADFFVSWALSKVEEFKRVAATTSRFCKLTNIKHSIEGNHVYLNFEFFTADASGQNMVTIATDAICNYIFQHSPFQPVRWYVEANFSGDKKASSQSFQTVRGKKVAAEVIIPKEVVEKSLHTTADQIAHYYQVSTIGALLSGTIGMQGHYANSLAALYLACGQDVACVAESAVGITRFECIDSGDLYASVTLPNLMVATVGGGTGLPSQKTCLEILGLSGPGNANAFAEVAAGLCLAGEISIAAAISSGEFTQAHKQLARGNPGAGEGR
ncbi:MAG: hydroxymethylglutaryl-CoA reductase [Desulfobacterales bacterium]|jgi:hydroxymethylglutaryl-CoA reductase (NADPH)